MKSLLMISLLITCSAFASVACGGEQEASAEDQSHVATSTAQAAGATGQRVEVKVNERGYEPSRVSAAVGKPLTLVFTRTSDKGCGDEVVVADHDIRKALPLNQPVEVTFTPTKKGEVRFSCGMNMYDGAVVVQ